MASQTDKNPFTHPQTQIHLDPCFLCVLFSLSLCLWLLLNWPLQSGTNTILESRAAQPYYCKGLLFQGLRLQYKAFSWLQFREPGTALPTGGLPRPSAGAETAVCCLFHSSRGFMYFHVWSDFFFPTLDFIVQNGDCKKIFLCDCVSLSTSFCKKVLLVKTIAI